MKYFFLKLCTALKLIETFQSHSATRKSDILIRVDDHYDDTILTAKVNSPPFLSVNDRSVTSQLLSTMHSFFPITILDLAYIEETSVALDTNSLIFFDAKNLWNPSLTQYFMHPTIASYTKLVVSSFIVIYSSSGLAVFTYDKVYPKFVAEYFSLDLVCVQVWKDLIILADNTKIWVLRVEDVDLGILTEEQKFFPGEVNLTEFRIRDMIVEKENLFVLDENLGLCQLGLYPIRVEKFFDVSGYKLAGFIDSICVDGKFVIDSKTYKVISYNFTEKCEFLAIDHSFIYCGLEDRAIYMSRFLKSEKNFTTRSIKGMVARNSVVFTAFKDSVVVEEVRLSPLYLSGTAPSEVSDYKVMFQVWSPLYETDKEEFLLKILYTLTDVVLFIVFCFFVVLLIVGCTLVVFRVCRSKEEEEKIIFPRPVPQDSINPGETIRNPLETVRNPFSERRLVERTNRG